MMLVGSALKGFALMASDGRFGTVSDFLFDDMTWKIRWMVVDTGTWLTGRKILVHPSAIGPPNYPREELPVRLTKDQVRDSPEISSDAPVSRQVETRLYGYYGWNPLWGGRDYLGSYLLARDGDLAPPARSESSDLLEAEGPHRTVDDGDPHLRSVAAVVGYHIQAEDGPIGHIENFIVDDDTWTIRYLIIDTRNWWAGRHVLMSPRAVREISWPGHDVTLDVTRGQVRGSPAWDPSTTIERQYEERLDGHYGWPAYGWPAYVS